MARPTVTDPHRGDARTRLLDAGRDVIRAKGYAATTLDDLCLEAGVTKGAFFHHFQNKEALGVAVAQEWNAAARALFAAGRYHELGDPLERVLGYVAFRKHLIVGELAQFTCLAGTVLQEVYDSSPPLREVCARSILDDAAALQADIAEAMALHGAVGEWTAQSLARHMQAVIQGSFILAKATGDRETAREGLDHLARYVELLFPCPASTKTPE
jgi:TetR/AcrR family transcriptional regulator, transcriptional repressor for nem operon